MPFDDAVAHVSCAASALGAERVELAQALGRIVAEPIVARTEIVPYDRSAMDGFAVRASDVAEAQDTSPLLPIGGPVYARRGLSVHEPRTATPIATGAPIPLGADAVIPIEETRLRAGFVEVLTGATRGEHVFFRGDDARVGDVLVRTGERLNAASLGLLGAAGTTSLRVVRRPRVAIVCTGDELVDVHIEPGFGEIRNSNAIMLASLVAEAGGDVCVQRVVRDDRAALYATLAEALSDVDLVITNGGASVGARDFVKSTLEELGVELTFRSVAMRPGRPTAFGRRGTTLVGVLPGNPAAAFVGFMEVIRPAITRLSGSSAGNLPKVTAHLQDVVHAKAERHYILFGKLSLQEDAFVVAPLRNQCSSLVRTAKDANSLIVLPPRGSSYQAGALVEAHVLAWELVAGG